MEYIIADDLEMEMRKIVEVLEFDHIDPERVSCIRSRGSTARRVIARVHGLAKPVQLGMRCKPHYVIEFLERFEKCSPEEKIETIIHELLHIPKNFGGGFRHHDYVTNKTVKKLYKEYISRKKHALGCDELFDRVLGLRDSKAVTRNKDNRVGRL